jgi:hypothetical protein
MGKKIILHEHQVKKLIESRINDFNIEDIAHHLESIDCSGEDLKYLVTKILRKYGYEDVKVLFLGYEEQTKDLRYMVHTEGPLFVYKTKSEVSAEDRPCLTIYDVKVYQQI